VKRSLIRAACALILGGSELLGQSPATQPVTRAGENTPAADSVLEGRTSAVAAQLRCPVCQGLSIQDSPSGLAQSMRAVVREQLAQGRTPDDVKAYFVSKYGEWILLAPKARGFNLVAYLVPVVVVVAGVVVIGLAVRRWTGSTDGTPVDVDAAE